VRRELAQRRGERASGRSGAEDEDVALKTVHGPPRGEARDSRSPATSHPSNRP
jgi:hypothetical protein